MPLIEILEKNNVDPDDVNQNNGQNNHLIIEDVTEDSSGIHYHLFSGWVDKNVWRSISCHYWSCHLNIELHTDSFAQKDAKISSDGDSNNEKQNCVELCEVTEIKHNDENKEIITGCSVTKEDKNGTNQVEKSKKELDSKYFRFNFINLRKYIFL